VGLFAGKHGERTARTEKNGKARQSAVQKWTAESRRRAKMDGGVTPPCKNGRRSYAAVQTWNGGVTPSQPPKDGEVTIILLFWAVRSQRQVFSTAGGQKS